MSQSVTCLKSPKTPKTNCQTVSRILRSTTTPKRMPTTDPVTTQSLQDSVIILSDSETENDLTPTNTSSPRFQCNLLRNICSTKKKSRQRWDIVYPTKRTLDSSCICISDSEDKISQTNSSQNDNPKSELNQMNEDISVVWTSCRPSIECLSENNLFYVDKQPDMKNLQELCHRPPRKKIKRLGRPSTEPNLTSDKKVTQRLRPIVIDGMNVGMAHTNGKHFSEQGLQIVIDHFESKGHSVIVFIPQHMRSDNRQYLEKMYKKGTIVFTPSRLVGGKRITSYDDNYIINYATKCSGIVISQDQYRDVYKMKPEWRETIANQILVPTFVGNYVMFPEDPLGRKGPNLDQFLKF